MVDCPDAANVVGNFCCGDYSTDDQLLCQAIYVLISSLARIYALKESKTPRFSVSSIRKTVLK